MAEFDKAEFVKNVYSKLYKFVDSLDPVRKPRVNNLLDSLGTRYFTAPASQKADYHSCFPGGLATHSMIVLKNLVKLIDTFSLSKKCSKDSIIILSLFHDLGKVGTDSEDYYIINDDDYWFKKGHSYKINEKLLNTNMAISTLFLLQKYNIELSFDEIEAIYCLHNPKSNFKENYLTLFLQWADRWSIELEKQNKVILSLQNDIKSVDAKKVVIQSQQDQNDGKSDFDLDMTLFDEIDKKFSQNKTDAGL